MALPASPSLVVASRRAHAGRTGWTGNPWAMVGVWFLFSVLLLLREPGIVRHAAFWAEDGWVWYPDAYNHGLGSLVRPLAGYLQTVSRLVGLVVQPLPLAWAPGAFAASALALQALAPAFLVSSRMEAAFPDLRGRLLFALLWVGLPNTREVFANLTNAQWHLAALAFLVLVSRPPATRAGQVFDGAALLVSGLSGPFCLVLAPVAAWVSWSRRDAAALWRLAAVLGAVAAQGACIMATIGERSAAPLGASAGLLARIVTQQVGFGLLLGQEGSPMLLRWPPWANDAAPWLAALVAAAMIIAAMVRGGPAVRLAVLAAGLLFAAAMLRPQVTSDGPQWEPMLGPGVGQRYYYLPMLAWMAVLFTLVGGDRRGEEGRGGSALWRRVAGGVVLLGLSFGVWQDWAMPQRRAPGFKAQVRAFQAAPAGTAVRFAFPPAFEAFPMILVKR